MTPIEKARDFIRKVDQAALDHPRLDQQIKNKVRNTTNWLDRFQRVGDLLHYLQRFEGRVDDPIYKQLKAHGLVTFEDIAGEFAQRFSAWAKDRTTPSSFVVGERYSTHDILILVGQYDTRAGGMFTLGEKPHFQAVVIKATLQGGTYPNTWLEPHQRLKYFLKSIKGVFGEHYQENAAILENPNIPIYTFVRSTNADDFTYEGIFHYHQITRENDGTKWFELHRADYDSAGAVVDFTHLETELHNQVSQAQTRSATERAQRLATAPKQPTRLTVQTTAFVRNADVIATVLARAQGNCEDCRNPAPFRRRSDGSPYLEVHHRIRLADGGEDTVENALALCPNCHRKAHYG